MLSYCFKCRKNTKSKNAKRCNKKRNNNAFIKSSACGSKKSRFIQE